MLNDHLENNSPNRWAGAELNERLENKELDSREGYLTDLECSEEERKDPSRNQGCQKVEFEPVTQGFVVQRSNHSSIQLQLLNRRKIFAIYAPTLLMYIVANLKSAILS